MNPLNVSTPGLMTVVAVAVTSSCATGTLARSGTTSWVSPESSRSSRSMSLVDEAELGVVVLRGRAQLGRSAGSIPFDPQVGRS